MLVASFETPAARGNSPTLDARRVERPVRSSSSTAATAPDSRSKSRVYARRAWERTAEKVVSTRSGNASLARRESRSHPVRAGDDRHVLGQLDVESTDDRSERVLSSLDHLYAEPLRPARVDLVEERAARSPAPSARPSGRTTHSLRSARPLPHPSRLTFGGRRADAGATKTYRHRSMPPTVESTRAFGSPAASGSAPTSIPSPTKRRKFDHITTDATRAR